MLLVLQTLLLLMIQVLLVDYLVLLLQLEHLLCVHLSVSSPSFDNLSTVIWRFKQLNIFHFLVISGVVLYLALIVLPYFILTAPSFNSWVVIQSFILEHVHLTLRVLLSFTEMIRVLLSFIHILLLLVLYLRLRCTLRLLDVLSHSSTHSWWNLTVVGYCNWSWRQIIFLWWSWKQLLLSCKYSIIANSC